MSGLLAMSSQLVLRFAVPLGAMHTRATPNLSKSFPEKPLQPLDSSTPGTTLSQRETPPFREGRKSIAQKSLYGQQ